MGCCFGGQTAAHAAGLIADQMKSKSEGGDSGTGQTVQSGFPPSGGEAVCDGQHPCQRQEGLRTGTQKDQRFQTDPEYIKTQCAHNKEQACQNRALQGEEVCGQLEGEFGGQGEGQVAAQIEGEDDAEQGQHKGKADANLAAGQPLSVADSQIGGGGIGGELGRTADGAAGRLLIFVGNFLSVYTGDKFFRRSYMWSA